jgi:subtilisin family serine protease
MSRRRTGTLITWLSAGALALAAAVGAGGASVAETTAQSLSKVPTASYDLTLITGDRVHLEVLSGGKEAATVDPAQRGEGVPEPVFQTVQMGGDTYVFPSDVTPYLGTRLDRNLFDVSKLVVQGDVGDPAPLIVDYKQSVGTLPPGLVKEHTLASIAAVAAREPRSKAEAFGRAIAKQAQRDTHLGRSGARSALARNGLFAGIDKIWLDEKVKVKQETLAESRAQIGVPTAWGQGYDGTGVKVAVLDTGIDSTHPDLQSKVVAAQDFVPGDPDVTDHFGHGTHVASIIAGSGAAWGGDTEIGMAPGADLLNGKVLNDYGSGLDSWIIAGMQWAADQGADVVNMSLGDGFTDGTDPMSQAVDNITASTGTLFVIAAGNSGATAQTVETPGAASAALTVGAVDESDTLAGFSSRGPRVGDYAIKPDITAPGVDIVAARAAGTSLGTPVNDFYTRLSGTSMATPHVAGAAALLAERHPSWDASELKPALVTTADPGPYTVYEQGGGRVDVARAFTQGVNATPAPVDFGYFPWPHDNDQPVTKTITYSNDTAADVTLDLTVDVTKEDGTPAAPGMITTSATSVTVAAGGTASVDVTVDTALGDVGLFGGVIKGQSADGSVVLRTPVGFYKEPVRYNLTVDGIARDGRPARGISWIDVVNTDDTTAFTNTAYLYGGPVTFRVPPGKYSVMGYLFTYDEPQVYALETSIAGDPELEVDHDATYVADARPATEVVANTDRPTASPRDITQFTYSAVVYRAGEHNGSFTHALLSGPPISRVFAAPTEPVTQGDFEFYTKWNLRAPDLQVSVVNPRVSLDPYYAVGSPKIDGIKRLDLVFAGYGRVQDFQGLDVRGKAVLISRGPIGNPITFAEKVANATAAGAAVAIIHNHSPGLLLIGLSSAQIPVLSLSLTQGLQLRDLLSHGRVRLDLSGTAVSPYIYDVLFPEHGRIAAIHQHTVDSSNTAQISAEYRGHVPEWLAGDAHHAFRPWSTFSFEGVRNFTTPFSRTEYVSVGDSRWWHQAWGSMASDYIFQDQQLDLIRTYASPSSRSDHWFAQPLRPGVIRSYEVGDNGEPVTREGNVISLCIPGFIDDEGRYGFQSPPTDTSDFRFFENDSLIAQGYLACGQVPVSESPATDRIELDVSRSAPYWALSTTTQTSWTFGSAPPAPGAIESVPLLLVDYDLGRLDPLNRSILDTQQIHLFVHRQQGAQPATISGVTASVSYDDGATWQPAPVRDRGGGNFVVTVENSSGSGSHVSLRIHATDSGGSQIAQTMIRAYGIR